MIQGDSSPDYRVNERIFNARMLWVTVTHNDVKLDRLMGAIVIAAANRHAVRSCSRIFDYIIRDS